MKKVTSTIKTLPRGTIKLPLSPIVLLIECFHKARVGNLPLTKGKNNMGSKWCIWPAGLWLQTIALWCRYQSKREEKKK